MKLQQFKTKRMKDPEFKKEYERFDLWFEIKQKWIELRCWLKSKKKTY